MCGVAKRYRYLVIITDGKPEGEATSEIEKAIEAVQFGSTASTVDEMFYTFTIGVGSGIDMNILNKLAQNSILPNGKAIIYNNNIDFAPLFKIISQSASQSALRNHTPQQQKDDIQTRLRKGMTSTWGN